MLTQEEQNAIRTLPVHAVHIGKKHDFVSINEEISYACLIASGMVGRFGQTANGLRQITAFHVPGDMADLHTVVRPIGVGGLNALTDTIILRVPHTAIRTVAARYPAIAEALWRDCMLDAAILMQWVVNVGRRDAQARLAHIFCEMAMRFAQDRKFLLTYEMPVTQEQLGDAAALTAVHVNRSLKTLSDLVTLKAGRVTIHDWARLARVGEFDAAYLAADTGTERQKRLIATEGAGGRNDHDPRP